MSAAALAAITDKDATELERVLAEHFFGSGWGAPGPGERRSWRNSLPVLARDLRDAGLVQVEVILEHRLPLSSKRADVVLAGAHPRTGAPSYVVVELKQWATAARWEGSDTLVEVDGAPYRPSLHPSTQVAGYVDYLRDFTASLAETPDAVTGLAYLHNATDYGVEDLRVMPAAQDARLVTGQRRGELHEFLQSRLALHEILIAVFMVVTTPITLMLLARAALYRDRSEGSGEVPPAPPVQNAAPPAPDAAPDAVPPV